MATKTLKERVQDCRAELKSLEIKNPKHYFCLKYPEYKPKDKSDQEAINKIDNLEARFRKQLPRSGRRGDG